MKMKNMFAVAGIVCMTASSASAVGTNVYITGSTAYRSAFMAYLRSKLTNTRAVFDKNVDTTDLTKSVDASSFIVMSGNFNGAGTTTTFFLSFTGAIAGSRDVTGPVNLAFPVKPADFTTNSAYLLGTAAPFGGVKGTTKDSNGNLTSVSTSNTPDFGFTDVFQESTIYTGTITDTKVAIVPFVWITAPGGAAAGITNMTPQIGQSLFKTGSLSLAHFSGNASDAARMVYALGRSDDSGTRVSAMAEIGVGVSAGLHQYLPVGNPVTSYTDVGNGGYVSGGDLSTAMKSTTNATGGYSVSYMGLSDADATTGATFLNHNGVSYPTSGDAAAIAMVSQGKYTFWCYEHLIDRNSCTGDALTVLTNLKSNLPTSFTSSRKTIRLDAMQCERTTDGEIVNHF